MNENQMRLNSIANVRGKFLGLYETLECLTVRGEKGGCCFEYGYSKENNKILYSHHKTRIPNSF